MTLVGIYAIQRVQGARSLLKRDEHRAETINGARIARTAAEKERTSTGGITITAPTMKERISRVREVRVVLVPRICVW